MQHSGWVIKHIIAFLFVLGQIGWWVISDLWEHITRGGVWIVIDDCDSEDKQHNVISDKDVSQRNFYISVALLKVWTVQSFYAGSATPWWCRR